MILYWLGGKYEKKVLITGVTKGIGRGIAEKFLENGGIVCGTYYSSKNEAMGLIEKYGKENVKLFGPYDFRNLDEIEKFVQDMKSYSFDTIITSAGMFSENDDFNGFDVYDFTKVMNCNFYHQLMVNIGLKDNIRDGGSIVLMASNDAYSGAYASMSCAISKSAVISLMKCLCVNFGKKNVRVNSVSPGAIDTDMNTDEQMKISPFFSPSGRVGKSIDVARVVYWLVSEEADFVNGENITIDGGYQRESILLKCEAASEFSRVVQDYLDLKCEE